MNHVKNILQKWFGFDAISLGLKEKIRHLLNVFYSKIHNNMFKSLKVILIYLSLLMSIKFFEKIKFYYQLSSVNVEWFKFYRIYNSKQCLKIIDLIKHLTFVNSTINSQHGTAYFDLNQRSSKSFVFTHPYSEWLIDYVKKIEILSGYPASHFGNIEIIKYVKGDYLKIHTDYLKFDHSLRRKIEGNRLKSVILYLNDNYEGGQIHFPILKLKTKPLAGSLFIIDNTLQGSNEENSDSVHESLEIIDGIKYIMLLFIYENRCFE